MIDSINIHRLRAFGLNIGIRGVNGLFTLIQLHLIISKSTASECALFLFSTSIIIALGPLLHFGENFSLVANIAETSNKSEEKRELLVSLLISLAFTTLLFCVFFLLAPLNNRLEPVFRNTYFFLWYILFFLNSHLSLYLRATGKFSLSNLLSGLLPNSILVFLLLLPRSDILDLKTLYGYAIIAYMPGGISIAVYLVARSTYHLHEILRYANHLQSRLKKNFSFFFNTLTSSTIGAYPTVVAGLLFNDSIVILMGILSRLFTVGMLPYNTMSTIVPTIVAQAKVSKQLNALGEKLRVFSYASTIFGLAIFVPLVAFPDAIFQLFTDLETSSHHHWIRTLSMTYLLSVIIGPVGLILCQVGKEGVTLAVQAISVMALLFFTISLITSDNFASVIFAYSIVFVTGKFFYLIYLARTLKVYVYA